MGCNVMDGQEMLGDFRHAPARRLVIYLNLWSVTVETHMVLTEAAEY